MTSKFLLKTIQIHQNLDLIKIKAARQITSWLMITSKRHSITNLKKIPNRNLWSKISLPAITKIQHHAPTTLIGVMKNKTSLYLHLWRKKLRLWYLSTWTCTLISRRFKIMVKPSHQDWISICQNFYNSRMNPLKELTDSKTHISIPIWAWRS
jgi:hypothetical protein